MKSMLILSQCMDLKSMMTDLGYELKVLICLVVAGLALSVGKVVYHHYSSTHNVRKIKQLLESSRTQRRSGDLSGSGPVSPLPRIERVPTCLSLRRRSSLDASVKITAREKNDEHNSSNESFRKLNILRRSSSTDQSKLLKPDSPPSRSHIKSSTNERKESPPRRSKNQIISAEMLM
jgi:hypothetical protein